MTKWEQSPRDFSSGEQCRLGKWVVGAIDYDAAVAKSEGPRYKATCRLPGIRSDLGHRKTMDEARSLVDSAVRHWLKYIEPEPEPDSVKSNVKDLSTQKSKVHAGQDDVPGLPRF